jgi:hypothetical protein
VPFQLCLSSRAFPAVPFQLCLSSCAFPAVPFQPCLSSRAFPAVPFQPCLSSRAFPAVPFQLCLSGCALPAGACPAEVYECSSVRMYERTNLRIATETRPARKSPNTNAFDGLEQGSRRSGLRLCQRISLACMANSHFEMTHHLFDRISSSHKHPLAIESFPLSRRLKTAYCSDGPSFKNLSKGQSPTEILESPAIRSMGMW